MTTSSYVIAALVITGAACTAGIATSQAQKSAEPMVCELRLSEANRVVTFSAEAEARQPMRGSYQFDIDQRSSGGRATIRQSGEFDLRAGERTVLGEVNLSGRARDFAASLTVRANGQTRTCGAASL